MRIGIAGTSRESSTFSLDVMQESIFYVKRGQALLDHYEWPPLRFECIELLFSRRTPADVVLLGQERVAQSEFLSADARDRPTTRIQPHIPDHQIDRTEEAPCTK